MSTQQKQTLYIVSVVLAGSIILIYSLINLHADALWSILFLGVLGAIAESLTVEIRGKGISVSSAITICAMLIHGSHAAVVVSALSLLLCVMKTSTGEYQHVLNIPAIKTALNTSNYAISNFLAGSMFMLVDRMGYQPVAVMSGHDFSSILKYITGYSLMIILYIFVYIVMNTIIIAVYYSLKPQDSFFQKWLADFLWSFASLFIVGIIGVLIAAIYTAFSWFVLLIFFAPLLLARFSFSLYSSLHNTYEETISALSSAIDAKDLYTNKHSQRVKTLAEKIGIEMGLSEKRMEFLKYAAILHDVGKIGVTESVLNKPGRLTDSEFLTIKQHPKNGAQIISTIKYLKPCINMVLYHHTYFNGMGYPDVQDTSEIPLEAFIIAVADAFDAMTSARPYRAKLSVEYALSEIESHIGTQFEPRCAKALISAIQKGALEGEKDFEHLDGSAVWSC